MNVRSYIQKSDPVLEAAEVARLLADPTRLRILQTLYLAKGDMCVYEIAEKVGSSQSATSHQLAKLEGVGVVRCFRDGQKMCYELTKTPLVKSIGQSLQIFSVI